MTLESFYGGAPNEVVPGRGFQCRISLNLEYNYISLFFLFFGGDIDFGTFDTIFITLWQQILAEKTHCDNKFLQKKLCIITKNTLEK